jgi:hypothetical protein
MFLKTSIMPNPFPIFRHWVPEWLIKVIVFLIIAPSLVLFFLPLTNLNAAAGYYGCEPADMQFAVALFYAGYAGFYSLERRFFSYLACKEYFVVFSFLQIITTFVCYHTQNLYILFPIRFVQGMLFACTVNLSLSLMFTRLRSERTREVSFSVFFGLLLCALPFNNLVTADLIDAFNFNVLYQCAVFAYLPGLFMLLISMNNVRLNIRFPLYQLDWQSFSLYSIILCLVGYITIFGQEYYWLEDKRIMYSFLALIFLLLLFVIRQKRMKRPYVEFRILKFRNYKVGLLLLFVMYICRFASGITNTFFSGVLRFDPMHVSYINTFNMLGLIIGVIVSCCMLLQKKSIRLIWLAGFVLLLAFHVILFFLFDTQANEDNFFAPLFLQGLGVGMLIVPTILYAISSVPTALGSSASAICLAIRYVGFCISIALINFYELYGKSRHYNAFQDSLTQLNPAVSHALVRRSQQLAHKGLGQEAAHKATDKLLVQAVNSQAQIRFAMDYYELMAWLLIGTLGLIIAFPYLNRTVIYLKSRRLAPI